MFNKITDKCFYRYTDMSWYSAILELPTLHNLRSRTSKDCKIAVLSFIEIKHLPDQKVRIAGNPVEPNAGANKKRAHAILRMLSGLKGILHVFLGTHWLKQSYPEH